MKRILLPLLAFFFISLSAKAQLQAVTENGDTLVIFANGTWDYLENFREGKDGFEDVPINENSFLKPDSALQNVMGKSGSYKFFYNRSQWRRLPPGQLNEDAEFAFSLKDEDAYVILIFEKFNIPIENLTDIALSNLIEMAPNANLDLREWRKVNGNKVMCQQVSATVSGIDIIYFSYFFSDKRGSIQLHTFCGKDFFQELKPSMEEALNGLVIE